MNVLSKEKDCFVISMAKVSTYCDNCKQSIDTSKPQKLKNAKTGQKPQMNPAIEATLETTVDSGETKSFHFCDEICLYQFLKKRYSK